MGPSAADDDDGKLPYCVGSPTWNPSRYIADSELHARAAAHLERDDFYSAIAASFSLPSPSPPPPAPPSDDNDDNNYNDKNNVNNTTTKTTTKKTTKTKTKTKTRHIWSGCFLFFFLFS